MGLAEPNRVADAGGPEPAESASQFRPAANEARGASLPFSFLGALGFAALYALSSFVREQDPTALTQAVVWLPSGVGIAGLWVFGWRAWWCVLIASAALRASIGYELGVILPSALGSVAEATLGAWLLVRWRVSPSFARLRDVLALFAVAALAPFGSILFSWFARSWPGTFHELPFYSGWDGWWAMNALGILVVVPFVGTWLSLRKGAWTASAYLWIAALVAVLIAVLGAVMLSAQPGPRAMIELYSSLPIALYAAMRFGMRGAAITGAVAVLVVAVGTSLGVGPFTSVPLATRHVPTQMFGLTLIGLPLVFGALIAEREFALASRVRSEATRRALQHFLPDVAYRIRADGTIVDEYGPHGGDAVSPGAAHRGVAHVVRQVEALGSAELAAQLRRDVRATLASEDVEPRDYRMTVDGRECVREAHYARLGDDEVLCLLLDVTRRKRTEHLLSWEADALERIAKGAASRDVLRRLVEGIEQLTDGGIGSALLLEGDRLVSGVAVSLPQEYMRAIDGAAVGPRAGSCGTAAFRNDVVVVEDIATDPLWKDYASFALPHGLRACWSVPIRAADGRVLGTFAIYYRQPRKPAADELGLVERAAALAGIALERERREELLASIDRDVNEGLFRSTPRDGIVYANAALARMFGYGSPRELLEVDPAGLFVDPERRADLLRSIERRGSVANEEAELRRRDGTTFVGLISCVLAPGLDGSPRYLDGVVSDVTQRKQLEEQLRQAQKLEAVGRLAGGVAHDFNNLLTVITGCAESLLDQTPVGSRGRQDTKEILRAAERGAALTKQLLAYGRQQVLAPRVLDLTRIVDELGAMLRRLIGADVRLVVEHAGPRGLVKVDRGQIEQVLLNLALNARDALPNGGTVRITTARLVADDAVRAAHPEAKLGSYVRLSVEDDGVGMDAGTRARAFDPFFTTKELGKGTGLGLSTVYGIVRQSDGWIALASEPGAGTRVDVHLPEVDEPSAFVPEPPAALPSTERAERASTILVVEDEEVVRELITVTLQRAGYTVLVAENGARALEIARSTSVPIEALVSDVVMPGIGGRELMQRLRADRPDLRVLFVSGYTADSLPKGGDGDFDYLQKPFTRAELLDKLAAMLAPAS
jgi:PAS domain S-box-containing protein